MKRPSDGSKKSWRKLVQDDTIEFIKPPRMHWKNGKQSGSIYAMKLQWNESDGELWFAILSWRATVTSASNAVLGLGF